MLQNKKLNDKEIIQLNLIPLRNHENKWQNQRLILVHRLNKIKAKDFRILNENCAADYNYNF